MRKLSSRQWFFGLVLLGGVTLIARQLAAEVPTIKGLGKVLSTDAKEVAVPNGVYTTLEEVPAGEDFVLTDVIIVNPGAAAATFQIVDRDPGVATVAKTPAIAVDTKANFNHTFTTGVLIPEKHELSAFVVSTAGSLSVMVNGYFRKK